MLFSGLSTKENDKANGIFVCDTKKNKRGLN